MGIRINPFLDGNVSGNISYGFTTSFDEPANPSAVANVQLIILADE